MGRIIGIDLGTTNSLAAVWENGESRLIPNVYGEYLTPSVVSAGEDGTIYSGKIAKERLITHPGQTAGFFKRFMGTAKKYELGDKVFLPEELSAVILKKLKEDAQRYLGEPVDEAIVSVPAYFGDMARNATKRAGKIAGIKVERIINEPSAAALACQKMKMEEDAVILVFDFGGGTLDVSLVECFDNVIEIIAVSGDNQLGGQDFDDAIGRYFIRQCQLDPDSLLADTRAAIWTSAEQCKRDLTEYKNAVMSVSCPQLHHKIELTRKDIVTICPDLFERMGKPVRQVLLDGKKRPEDLNRIVLVGGSCRMPVVKQYLKHLLGRSDIETMYPDHMIAYGAGACAGIKERNEEIKDMVLTDICPFSLGTNIVNEQNPRKSLMSFIIHRNSPLPVSKEQSYFNAYDGQKKIIFGIYQGEAMYAEDNILLGRLEFRIPPRPSGTVEILVRYTYDINGVLEVDIHIPVLNKKKRLVVVNKELDMTDAQIEEKLKEMEGLKINPAKEEENKFVLAWGERLFMQCSADLQQEIGRRLQYFRYILNEDVYRIEKVRKYLTVFLSYAEGLTGAGLNWNTIRTEAGSWYQEEDEEQKEIEEAFQSWEDTEE